MNMDEESGDCGSLAAGTATTTTTTAEHQQQPKIEQNESPQLQLQQQQQQQEQSSSSSTSSSSVSSSAAAAAALSAASSAASSSSSSSTTAATTTASSSSSTTTTQAAPSTNLEPSHNDLFSTKRWGTTPIRQDTPWELPPSPTQANQPQASSSSSLASSSAAAAAAAAAAHAAAAAAAAAASLSSSTILPPGISQSGDSANGLATSLGQMSLGLHSASRFDQPWRAQTAINKPQQHQANSVNSFANHNQLNNNSNSSSSSSGNGTLVGGVGLNSFVGSIQQQQQPGSGFARAPGPASSIMDNNSMTPKPFGMANRSSTWSAFGAPPTPNSESEREWPKSTISGISAAPGNHHHHHQQQQQNPQPSNAFDLVPDFGDPGKSWNGSMLMKGLGDDDPTSMGSQAAAAVSAFANANPYGATGSSKSPSESQYEPSGIGTWSPIVKGGRPGSKWDGDGPGDGRGDDGRFDDGTAIWGSPAQTKVVGVDWVEKTGDPNSNNQDKSRPLAAAAGNNQSSSTSSYRPLQQSSSASSTSLLMSSNTSPPSQQQHQQQHNRGNQQQQQQQNLKQQQHSLSHNFDQVQQQSNALSSQANQPSRGSVLSSNVPSTQQLKHMVQQIQLAVQAGHLNPQILNQPLAPITLQLLYQLLQQIKILHQLQISVAQQFNKPGSHPAAINVHITKTKQNILNLQNQIAAQQAVFLKQHQHQPQQQQQQQQQQHNISSSRQQPTMPTTLTTGGVGGGIGPTLPPGISQSGDSFRSGTSLNDFHGSSTMINNFGIESMGGASANGLGGAGSGVGGGHMSLLHASRFDQPWRAPAAMKPQHHQTSGASQFATNHNLNSSGNGGGVGSVNFVSSMQQQGNNEFARAPGPATSLMDNNSMTPKPFGMANRSSTWSAFGAPAPNEPEAEWPKTTTTSGISAPGNSTQPSNAFDLVPEFEPGKPWRGSMLMKSVEDDPTMTPGSMARSLAPQRKTIWSDEIL